MSLYDKKDGFPFRVQNYPHLDSNVPCMPMNGVYISQLLRFTRTCDRYLDFLARDKCLVQTLFDQGFRHGLLCKKIKQFYWSHHSLVQHYSHSVTQHLQEGVDSQVRWGRICVYLVGAAVTGTDGFNLPFHWCSLGLFLLPFIFFFFSFFLFFFFLFSLSLFFLFIFYFYFYSVLLIFKLFFIYFLLSFFLSLLSFLFFSFIPTLSSFFFLNLCLFNSLSSEYARFCNVYR